MARKETNRRGRRNAQSVRGTRRHPSTRKAAGKTRRSNREILSEIDALERQFRAVDEAEIENWSDDLAAEEEAIAEASTGIDVGSKDQNLSASEREKVARTLLKCASLLLAECGGDAMDEAEEIDEAMDEEGVEIAASRRRARIRARRRRSEDEENQDEASDEDDDIGVTASRRRARIRARNRRSGEVPESFKENQFKKDGEKDDDEKDEKKASMNRRGRRSRRPRGRRHD